MMPDASAVDLFVNCCSLITKAFFPNRIDVVSQNGTLAVASNPNAKKNVKRQIHLAGGDAYPRPQLIVIVGRMVGQQRCGWL